MSKGIETLVQEMPGDEYWSMFDELSKVFVEMKCPPVFKRDVPVRTSKVFPAEWIFKLVKDGRLIIMGSEGKTE